MCDCKMFGFKEKSVSRENPPQFSVFICNLKTLETLILQDNGFACREITAQQIYVTEFSNFPFNLDQIYEK